MNDHNAKASSPETPLKEGKETVRLNDTPSSSPAPSESPLPYAGFTRRASAFLIDISLIAALSTVFTFPFWLTLKLCNIECSLTPGVRGELSEFIPNFMFLLVHWLYTSLLESSRFQATPGKVAFGLIVTGLAGQPVSFLRASGRNLAKLLSDATLGVGFVMAAFTEKRQALHDSIAGCLVLRKER